MQVLKDEIRRRIVKEALGAFLERGYAETSMRELARRVGTSVSNIYHYFSNKEELFSAVAEPIAQRVKQVLREIIDHEAQGDTELVEEKYVAQSLGELIKGNRREFLLLMDRSGGTGYESVKREIINAVETHIIQRHFTDSSVARQPGGTFIMHVLAANLIEALIEIARHGRDARGIDHSLRSLMRYHLGGVAHLMS